jgi:hypothetical protein
MEPLKFPSKKDSWITALLFGIVLLMFCLSLYMFVVSLIRPMPLPLAVQLILGPFLLGILLIWIFFSTGCEIRSEHFVAHAGPFRFKIPLARIVKVAPMRNLFTTPDWDFALSFDRIHVWYRKKSGKIAWPIAVSPENKAEFLRELARAVPNLHVDQG